jgi:hypothetical protein
MVRFSAALMVGSLALLGCDQQGEPELVPSADIRIDMASPDTDPDSEGTRMCVNDAGEIYVVWTDDRDGQPAVYLNRSIDRGNSWLPAAVKINSGVRKDDAVSHAENPDLACTSKGVHVVWEDDRDGELENHQIYFNTSEDGGLTWREDDMLLETDVDGLGMSLGPRIAAVGADLYVVWFDGINGSYDIYMNSSGNGGLEWREPQRLDSDAPGEAHSASPQIAAAGSNVYVTWEDTRAGRNDIYFTRSDDSGNSFRDDRRIDGGDDDGAHHSFAPVLGVSGDHVYVVWHDTRNGEGRDIFYNYSSNSGKDWLDVAVRLDSDQVGFHNSIYADIEVDGATAHVAWQDERNNGYDIFYRKIVSGDPEAAERRVESDPEGFSNSVSPRVAYGNGTLVVAWEDARAEEAANGGANGYNDLYYNFSQDAGLTFNPDDLRIDSMLPGQSFKVELNVEVSGGDIFCAWTDGRNGTADVYFTAYPVGEAAVIVETEGATGTATTAE